MAEKKSQQSIEQLEQELVDLQYSEKLQQTLFKIASLSHGELDLESLYQQVHDIVDEVLEAKNFFIALVDEDQRCINMVYFVDEKDNAENDFSNRELPLGEGLTSYVVKTRQPQLLTIEDINILVNKGEIKEVLGSTDFSCWIGAPMIIGDSFHGVIVAQSYQPQFSYSSKDLMLLDFVANQVASAIENNVNESQRRDAQQRLAEQHRLLEQQNKQLNNTIDRLHKTQQELVQREKMASLGGLVAGIAHEINTPLGICVTGISHLREEYKHIKNAYDEQNLSENDLIEFFNDLEQGLSILESNTNRGASLVKSFKQVAVDQSSNESRVINIKNYIDEILLSLKPRLKRLKHEVHIDCPEDLNLKTNAGALSQIFSNLILNSVIHGFESMENGRIQIKVQRKKNSICIHYADNGKGLNSEELSKLFEPFFTTKRGEGGSGLGTHLVYNLVQSLEGSIKIKSELNKGLAYLITLPFTL